MKKAIAILAFLLCCCICFSACGESSDVTIKLGSIEFRYDSSILEVVRYEDEFVRLQNIGASDFSSSFGIDITPIGENWGIDYYKQYLGSVGEIIECQESEIKGQPIYTIAYSCGVGDFQIAIIAICEDQDYLISVYSIPGDKELVYKIVEKIEKTIVFK